MTNNSWHFDSFEQYLTKDGLNSHSIPYLLRSASHYKAMKEEPRVQTDSMAFGTLFHLCALEPQNFSRLVVEPEGDKRSSKFRETLKEWVHSLDKNALVVSQEDFDKIRYMYDSLLAHPIASSLIKDGHNERSGYLNCPEFDVAIKLRPDIKKENMVIDLKTTRDAEYSSFQGEIKRFHYDTQAAFYRHYANILSLFTGETTVDTFLWVAVEKEAPFGVMVYEAHPNTLSMGMEKVRRGIEVYQQSLKSNKWDGYNGEINMMHPSFYPKNEWDGVIKSRSIIS